MSWNELDELDLCPLSRMSWNELDWMSWIRALDLCLLSGMSWRAHTELDELDLCPLSWMSWMSGIGDAGFASRVCLLSWMLACARGAG